MIISHKHRYLFVEFPRTGSTAIGKELCMMYDGTRILRKHSTYREFLKHATQAEREYFVFSGIRNPLDDAVSHYFKLKTDHRSRYTDPTKVKRRVRLAERYDNYLYNYIHTHDIDFATFFQKFYRIPYNNWATAEQADYDYVIRFENIQRDFTTALEKIGIQPLRPLPARNVTGERKREYYTYYTPELIPRAKRIFGPFMQLWGYKFPPGWGDHSPSTWEKAQFYFFDLFRRAYWSLLRPVI